MQSVPGQGETTTALQDFKGRRDCRQLADAVTMELAADCRQLADAVTIELAADCRQLADTVTMELASEMHPERGTGFASAAMKWSDILMRESIKKNPEGMEKLAQVHR